jgi:hypothetical protein
MVNPNRFYTYAYLREDKTPYYIGKGSGCRIYRKKGRPCSKPKDKFRIIFLKQNLTEEEAFKHEKYMIAVFGRKDLGTGILHNKTDGGDGCSGLVHKESSKNKMSSSIKGVKYWNNGVKTVRRIECPGKGWIQGRLDVKYPTRNGCHWWNNGEKIKLSKNCPGEEWVKGCGDLVDRSKCGKHNNHKSTTKGYYWWNNGKVEKYSKESPGKEWVAGKIKLYTEEEQRQKAIEKSRNYYKNNREKILKQKQEKYHSNKNLTHL